MFVMAKHMVPAADSFVSPKTKYSAFSELNTGSVGY
jgi:hypothetical protein